VERIHLKKNQRIRDLSQALAGLPSATAVACFLEDLCTPSELTSMADRWHVVGLLEQRIPYRKINELTGVSTATITRVARCLSNGTGGYRQSLLKRAKEAANDNPKE